MLYVRISDWIPTWRKSPANRSRVRACAGVPAMCGSIEMAAEIELSTTDRELLLTLRRALSELKMSVERTLLEGWTYEQLAN